MKYNYSMKSFAIILMPLILTGCYYGVNSKTSEIGNLNTNCLDKNAWSKIYQTYSISNVEDSIYKYQVNDFKNMAFETDLLYFSNNPKEIIAVSTEHYSVRYVFNSSISNQILDGLSLKLKEEEKKRIRNRVQKILMEYQCEIGKKESEILMSK